MIFSKNLILFKNLMRIIRPNLKLILSYSMDGSLLETHVLELGHIHYIAYPHLLQNYSTINTHHG